MKALVIDVPDRPLPPTMMAAIRDAGWEITRAPDYGTLMDETFAKSVDVVLLTEPPTGPQAIALDGEDPFGSLLRHLDHLRVATLILPGSMGSTAVQSSGLIEYLEPGISPAELRGRLAMIGRYQRYLRQLEQELANMERLGRQLHQHFNEVDQEMQLAARLQRDFLPKLPGNFPGIRFSTVYRPATWVSGDIFDVFRVDENHTAFYVADAVGHGMAAGLLTIFIKRTMIAQRIEGDRTRILSPAETMTALNAALVDQGLPNCQFVTAWYGLFDHRTSTLRFARGGHPYPLLIHRDGTIHELQAVGGLLGIFKEEEFRTEEVVLAPGDKVIVYTDGLESALPAFDPSRPGPAPFVEVLGAEATGSIADLTARLEHRFDSHQGSLDPQDDLTILGMEVLAG